MLQRKLLIASTCLIDLTKNYFKKTTKSEKVHLSWPLGYKYDTSNAEIAKTELVNRNSFKHNFEKVKQKHSLGGVL